MVRYATKALRLFQFFGIIFEKVVVKGDGDSPEQVSVQVVLFQDAVHIGAVGVQFPSQPRHTASLLGQFLVDDVTDVYHSHEYEKESGTIHDLSSSEVPPSNLVYG